MCGRGAWREKPTHPNRAGCQPAQPPPQLGRRLWDLPLFWVRQEVRPAAALWFPVSPSHLLPHQVAEEEGAELRGRGADPPLPGLPSPDPHVLRALPLPQGCTQPSRSARSVGGSSQMRQRKGPVLEQFSVPTPASHTGRPFPSQPPRTHLCRGFIRPASGQPVGSARYLKPLHSSELLSGLRGAREGCWEDSRGAGWGHILMTADPRRSCGKEL